jgi:phi13 family phage major tail protein
MASSEIFEFRGVDNLVYAPVLVDTKEQFVTGDVKWLSPVAEIGRTTATSSESHYYDNKPMIVISSVGADELSLTVAPLDLPTYAEITGQTFDGGTGSLIEGERNNKYFAIGYRTKGTDGKYRYVWRYKCMFSIPEESNSTENDGTDTTNTQLTCTCVQTIHEFAKHGKSAKAIVCDERFGAVDFSTFFDEVKTPDNLVGTNIDGVANPFVYPDTSIFNTMLNVSIVCATPNAKIYYTTDGTEPNSTDGTEYTTPFIINDTTTIKAIAYADGKPTSNVTTKIYTRI